MCRVQNFVRYAQALDRAVVQDVRLNNFVHVLRAYPAIENAFRIDHYRGTKLTLIQAAGFVCAYQLNPALCQFRLEQTVEAVALAARPTPNSLKIIVSPDLRSALQPVCSEPTSAREESV